MFQAILDLISSLGAVGVGLVMFAENVFPPIPSELVMPLAGYLVAQGELSLFAVIVCGTLGSVLGALFWYRVAQRLGHARLRGWIARHGRWLTISAGEFDRASDWFNRHQGRVIFWGRMIPGIRTLISVPAGLADMPIIRFLALTTLGSLIWNGALIAAGFVLRSQYVRVGAWLDPVTTAILFGIIGVYLWRLLRSFQSSSD